MGVRKIIAVITVVLSGAFLWVQTANAECVIDPKTGCKAVNPNPIPNETITWTGECRNGLTQGLGAVIWFKDGKLNGFNVANFSDGQRATVAKEDLLPIVHPFAQQGNPWAQNELGFMYYAGNGVSQDYAEALRWYRKSVEQGDASARNNLGVMYQRGKGVSQDLDRAKLLYRKSAAQGIANAKKILADIADGGFKVCNKSHDDVSVAYATYTGRDDDAGKELYVSQGWRNVDAGECATLWDPPLNKLNYYVFAQASDKNWSGDYPFCILDSKFRPVETRCGEGFKRKFFSRSEVEYGSIKFTYTFNP